MGSNGIMNRLWLIGGDGRCPDTVTSPRRNSDWFNVAGLVNQTENRVLLSNITESSDWTLATDTPVENSDTFVYLPLVASP